MPNRLTPREQTRGPRRLWIAGLVSFLVLAAVPGCAGAEEETTLGDTSEEEAEQALLGLPQGVTASILRELRNFTSTAKKHGKEAAIGAIAETTRICFERQNWDCVWANMYVLALGGRLVAGYANAGAALESFLRCKNGDRSRRLEGDPDRPLLLTRAIQQEPALRRVLDQEIVPALEKEACSAPRRKASKKFTRPSLYAEAPDFFYTLGHFDLAVEGEATCESGVASSTLRISIDDFYDWEVGTSADDRADEGMGKIKNEWFSKLVEVEKACNLYTRAKWTETK